MYLIVISLLVTGVGTANQLLVDYKRDKAHVAEMLRHIEVSFVPVVAASLWILDQRALMAQIKALLKYPDIVHVEVTNDILGAITVGDKNNEDLLEKTFPVKKRQDNKIYDLGTLTVSFSLTKIFHRHVESLVLILLTELVKIALLVIFVFVLFYYMVGRHLESLAEYTKNLDYSNLSKPLNLRKKKHRVLPDELDILADSINRMRINLAEYFSKMFRYQEDLIATNQQLVGKSQALRCNQTELETALSEKTVLLQEVHHRVKNNLQVIASIINLQAARIDDPDMLRIFNDLRGRIHSMAAVHELLYRQEKFSGIEFSEYVKVVCNDLCQLYSASRDRVRLEFDLESVCVPINHAVPCALALSELVTNALKHAFSGQRHGTLKVGFCLDAAAGEYIMYVEDDGPGISDEFFPDKSNSLGMTLLKALTDQLSGRLKIERFNGTRFVIVFPAKLD